MCEILAGYNKPKCPSIGGLSSVVVINIDDISLVAPPTLTVGGQEIDSLTLKDGKKGFKFNLDIESSNFKQTITRSREKNSYFVAQSLMMIIKEDSLLTQETIEPLGRGTFIMIAMESNGLNRVLGLNSGMTLETEENESGQAHEDMNGSTLNFMGKDPKRAPIISTAIVNALLVPIS
jgi:hypothetical protein